MCRTPRGAISSTECDEVGAPCRVARTERNSGNVLQRASFVSTPAGGGTKDEGTWKFSKDGFSVVSDEGRDRELVKVKEFCFRLSSNGLFKRKAPLEALPALASLITLHFCTFVRLMTADHATCRGSKHSVMAGEMAGSAAYQSTFYAAFGFRRRNCS
jgi:hypothetical protein